MTFLEVVFAVAMLGVVAASLFGAYGFAIAGETREQRRLGAAEVANRLILNYLDSPSGMPDPSLPVKYGDPPRPLLFRWEYFEEPVRVVEAYGDRRDRARESPLKNDRFRQITVRVWLSELSGGSRYWEASTPSVTISRMLDPVAPRNPDSYMAMIKNPSDFQRLIEAFMGKGRVSAPAAGSASSGFDRTGGPTASGSFSRSRVRPAGGGTGGRR
jgi:hypothetical protein